MRNSFSLIELIIFITLLSLSMTTLSSTNSFLSKTTLLLHHQTIQNYLSSKLNQNLNASKDEVINNLKEEHLQGYTIKYTIQEHDDDLTVEAKIIFQDKIIYKQSIIYLFIQKSAFDTKDIS